MATRTRKLIGTGIWVFNLASLCLGACLIAGTINALIGNSLRHLPGPESYRRADAAPRLSIRPPPDYRVIVERNLFGSAMARKDPPGPPELPVRVALSPLRASLIGTVVADDPAWSLGMIVDRAGSETGVYRIGDRLLGQATVVEVSGQRVYLERDGRLEYLTLGEEDSLASPFDQAAPASAVREPEQAGIQQTGPNRWRIDRTELAKITTNLSSVAVNVRIVPKIVEGQMQGFKLFSIRPGSIFSRLGFQNGDVIERVNGYRLSSPEIMLELYKKLNQARKVDIRVTRREKPLIHEYLIE